MAVNGLDLLKKRSRFEVFRQGISSCRSENLGGPHRNGGVSYFSAVDGFSLLYSDFQVLIESKLVIGVF